MPSAAHNIVSDGVRAHLSWIELGGGKKTSSFKFASWDGQTWTKPRTIASGPGFFVNWADFPSMIVLDNGALAAHWLEKSGGAPYAYDVKVSSSTDGGETWSRAFSPHRDGTKTEHGFVSLLPLKGGRFQAVWLDGRRTAASPKGPQALYSALYNGASFEPERPVDARTCDCCQTAAVEIPGGILAAYRDRSDAEVRDIYYARFLDGRWSAPKAIFKDGWKFNGCPVNGPALASRGSVVAAAWFTQGRGAPEAYAALSKDGGESFGEPMRLNHEEAIGRVDVEALDDGTFAVLWMEGGGHGARVWLRRLSPETGLGPPALALRSSGCRAGGFPRLARLGKDLLVAWTDASSETQKVRVSRLRAGALR